MRCLPIVAALAVPALASASPAIATRSDVFRESVRPAGQRRLEAAQTFARGDRVVTIVRWYRLGGKGGFTIVNPLPSGTAYQDSAREAQEVSVDGGRTWGQLDRLRIDGRDATAEDVTHVRWRIPASIAERGSGRIAYSAVVR
ncbi:hypothetical protein B2G71_15270 [Novosphingobium sp. PC22D]|nr:hypothetical protein B2G71_15270 [Novosphingobium sp. PC22D]